MNALDWRRGRDSNPRYGFHRTHAFQACDLNHSSTSPERRILSDCWIMALMNVDKWRHYARARLLELLRNSEGAMAAYREALAADPEFRRAANALAYRCAQAGRNAEAIECFERVLRLGARDAAAHFNLAFVYARSGQ